MGSWGASSVGIVMRLAIVVVAALLSGCSASGPRFASTPDWQCGDGLPDPEAPLPLHPSWAGTPTQVVERLVAAAGDRIVVPMHIGEDGATEWTTEDGRVQVLQAGPDMVVSYRGRTDWNDDAALEAFWIALGIRVERMPGAHSLIGQSTAAGPSSLASYVGNGDVTVLTVRWPPHDVSGLKVLSEEGAAKLAVAQKTCLATAAGKGKASLAGTSQFRITDHMPTWTVPLTMAEPVAENSRWLAVCGEMPLDVTVDARTGAILSQSIPQACPNN